MTDIELSVAKIEPDASLEYVCETILRLESLMQRAREVGKQFKAALVAYIKERGDVTIGTVRYYVGHPKKTDCRSNAEALASLLETLGVNKTAELLASNAWKYGSVASALAEAKSPEMYDKLFEVTYPEKLEEGKPKPPQLQKFDAAFVR